MFNTNYYKDANVTANNQQNMGNLDATNTNVQSIVDEVKSNMNPSLNNSINNNTINTQTNTSERTNRIPHDIIKRIVQLSQWTDVKGITNSRELNIVSWDKGPSRVDLRVWYKNNINDPNEEWKPGKGVAMSEQEAHVLCLALIEAGYAPGFHK